MNHEKGGIHFNNTQVLNQVLYPYIQPNIGKAFLVGFSHSIPRWIVKGVLPLFWLTISILFHNSLSAESGELWGMGTVVYDHYDFGAFDFETTPILLGRNVVMVAAGFNFTAFVTSEGYLMTVGDNEAGQLGDGTRETYRNSLYPVDTGVVAVSTGHNYTLYIKSNGTLMGMGYNRHYTLGIEHGIEDDP